MGKDLIADSAFTHSVVASYGQLYYVAPEQYDKLKSATERSDVFSLGRLLDFTLTGKTPLTIQPTSFRSLVEKATQGEPDLRHANVNEFEKSYESIKSLLGLNEEAGELGTLTKFTKPDGQIDWAVFRRFAVRGEYKKSVYNEYLHHIIEVLSDLENIKTFVKVAGDSIREFVNVFLQRIDELPSTGWPFSAISEFANILKNIFFLSPNMNVKLQCLKNIWKFAYESDQFGAQKIMLRLLEGNFIPEEIQMDLAVAITESKATVSVEVFSSPDIPQVLKRAILQKANA